MNVKLEIEFLCKVEKGGFINKFRLSHIENNSINLPNHYIAYNSKYKINYNGSNRYKGIFDKLLREDIIELLFINTKLCLSLTEKGVSYNRNLQLKRLLR